MIVDVVCSECGLVLESRSINETSKWRTFADDSCDHDLIRVEGPVNPLLGNASLSTVISKAPNGSSGDFSLLQSHSGDPDRAIVLAFKAIANMADSGEGIFMGCNCECIWGKESCIQLIPLRPGFKAKPF